MFPGVFGVPHDVCASSYVSGIISAISTLSSLTSSTYLTEVHFIDKNQDMVNMVQKWMHEEVHQITKINEKSNAMVTKLEQSTSKQPVCKQNLTQTDNLKFIPYSECINGTTSCKRSQKGKGGKIKTVKIGTIFHMKPNIDVVVKTDDILKENTDVLGCGQDWNLESHSKIASQLKKTGGKEYNKQIDTIRTNNPNRKLGDVFSVMMSKGVHPKVVMFVICPNWEADRGNEDFCKDGIRKCTVNALHEANKNHHRTITMPLFGTGTYKTGK